MVLTSKMLTSKHQAKLSEIKPAPAIQLVFMSFFFEKRYAVSVVNMQSQACFMCVSNQSTELYILDA